MAERPADLPDYSNPPVAEVALGLQFSTDAPMLAPHMGLYWQLVKDDFPEISHQPPMLPQFEDLTHEGPQAAEMSLHLQTGLPPLPRLWIMDRPGNRLIQLQADRFLHNWRKLVGDEPYPRFELLWDEFAARWAQFSEFCSEERLGPPKVTQAELTYVNHVLQGSCWESMSDFPEVFDFAKRPRTQGILPDVEAWTCSLRYRLPEQRGRMHVQVEPAIRTSDKQLMLRMILTVRGPMPEVASDEMAEWFQVARRYIVRGFTELTTDSAQTYWQRSS